MMLWSPGFELFVWLVFAIGQQQHLPPQSEVKSFTAQQPSVVLTPLFFLSACDMNVHHKCQTKVANLCGVNQKLMAEALAMIESTQQVCTLIHE